MKAGGNLSMSYVLSGLFLLVSMVFVWRSFYAMRIVTQPEPVRHAHAVKAA